MKYNYYFFLSIILFILPCCNPNYLKWGSAQIISAGKLKNDLFFTLEYLQTKKVYDQFITVGIFDVLWLTEPVRMTYVDLFATRTCLSDERVAILQEQQLEQLEETVSFYVLMNNDSEHILGTQASAPWSACLKINCQVFQPVDIKSVELNPDYIRIFGKRYSSFRNAYLVSFKAIDVNNKFILDGANRLELVLSSPKYRVMFLWKKGMTCNGSYSDWFKAEEARAY